MDGLMLERGRWKTPRDMRERQPDGAAQSDSPALVVALYS
jgi:hypothetical protein